jgi:transposase InsO family protein
MISLNTATYYHKPKASRAEREKFDADLRDQVERVQVDHPRAGYRMVLGYLRELGVRVGERRLRRVMRQFGLQARIKRAFIRTTDSRHSHRCYPNLLPGKKVTGLNQVWVSDLTYIRIENGFVYLAVIMDLFSRKIVGWNVSRRIDGELALGALRMALLRRRPRPGLVHHSDRGVQYLCGEYVKLLNEHGVEISNSAKGNPYHNDYAESLMKTLKQEEVYLGNYQTFLDVIENLPAFIEQVYNEKRLHSRLGYMTPAQVERLAQSNKLDGRFDLEL